MMLSLGSSSIRFYSFRSSIEWRQQVEHGIYPYDLSLVMYQGT